ncbi:phage replisome organizer N-terminal domain-containing protein [Blautia faecis]|uniref:phage replisome organizer N-terminal domain-containing protein n=1 Tax=Blautia faecis TaxID=871665 RepID=UPI0028A3820A|nr:phage replisome organizer N-terminal domain-containing protein [Blautia faecis]MDT4368266.1 phage replisome organizer N-terminal domain-containing protein [Blautia faecis]
MASAVKWIKICSDIFDDEKIMLIENLPSADSIIVIWFKLLCLAGKNNNSGVFILNDKIAYTDEMLATVFRRDINTVRLALKTFENYGMIEIVSGVYTIPNWGKYQNLDKIEQKSQYMRNYMQEYRKKQKDKIECKTNSKLYGKVNSKTNVSSAEVYNKELDNKELDNKELDNKEKEIEEENDLIVSKDTIRQTDVQRIIDEWNTLEEFGITPVKRMTPKREQAVKARIRQNHMDDILEAIENIRHSSFLQGQNKEGWMITFDWFLKPGNFAKVFEGNYLDKSGNKPQSYMEKIQNRVSEVDNWV